MAPEAKANALKLMNDVVAAIEADKPVSMVLGVKLPDDDNLAQLTMGPAIDVISIGMVLSNYNVDFCTQLNISPHLFNSLMTKSRESTSKNSWDDNK